MNRMEASEECPEEFQEKLDEVLNYYEQKVCEIRDLLNITSLNGLSDIETAYDVAKETAEELY